MGLLSGTYSQPPPVKDTSSAEGDTPLQKEQDGIRPAMFKTLIGTGHREFSSNRQQVSLVSQVNVSILKIGCARILSTSFFYH